jgi:hypothetical protein
MGLSGHQGDENSLKGTAFRPSITITITVALATEGKHFRQERRDLLLKRLAHLEPRFQIYACTEAGRPLKRSTERWSGSADRQRIASNA